MTVPASIRLLVVTADSFFSDYILAATDQESDISVSCVSTLSAARSQLTSRTVDCLVIDWELAPQRVEIFHRSVRRERSGLPVVLAGDRPQSALPASVCYHAFVRKGAPSMGASVGTAVRVLTTPTVFDRDTAPATAE